MIPVTLRAYQTESIDHVRAQLRAKHRRVLLCIPTGGGKTLTAASILASAVAKGSRVLFVAHRKELIDQTVTTFARLGITSIGVIRAQDPRRDPKAPIQIASIQTLARRDKPPADVVVIDEGHRALAKSYIKHLFESYPNAVFLLLTATPCRTDGRPLKDVADALVIGAKYSALIAQGHIVAPVVYGTPVLPDLKGVRTTGGDFNAEDLEAAVNRSALIGNCVAEWLKRSDRRATVGFAVSVAHSKALCEAFAEAGARAGHIDGTTPEDERAETLARLERHDLDIVWNVGVLCEGWDQPSCKCLVLARPTKSLGLYMQMAGRILRPWGALPPLILDHGGNVDRFGLPHEDREWSIEGRVSKARAATCKPCPECFCYVPIGVRICECGYDFGAGAAPEVTEREVVPVELALRTLDGPDAQLSFFRMTARIAAERGHKPGWIDWQYERRFGTRPPREWVSAASKGLTSDPAYRERRSAVEAARVREQLGKAVVHG